jgi:hypothetical protein
MQEVISDPIGKNVAQFMSAGSAIGGALIAPPAVSAARIAALRNDPKSGSETQAISTTILATPSDVISSAVAVRK